LAKVALAVSAPPQPAGRPTSCRSQSSATVSAASARRDDARTNAFWSSRDTTQSAASAAGVDPPITKWKKRGPADAVAVAVPTRSSVSTAAWVPDPCSGSDPPSSPSIGSAARSYTSRFGNPSRNGPAASTTRVSAASVSPCSTNGSPTPLPSP
jgi:hypothetical protein